ncbi:MAG: hypothetical protein ABSC22_11965 [Roseiarcus sp.]|jgi:hypothetical protein
MFKIFARGCAIAALALALAGCSTAQTQQFAANAAADAAAIGQVDSALIQLNTTVIDNTTQLAAALAKLNCPIVNASVSLGAAISADPKVAASVKAKLEAAGPAGALASDICVAAGFAPTTPPYAAPPAALAPMAAPAAPASAS